MANILSLAVKVTGDASGLQLTPVERALQRLQAESDKTAAIFDQFATSSEAGAKAQETFNASSQELLASLKAGNITRDEFVSQYAELEAGARQTAAALSEAARVIEANSTAEERYAAKLQRLNALREQGVLDSENYGRAVAAARKPLEDAAAASARAAETAQQSSLSFNELSGVFAVLPGPLGNIAGRISGIASASEGLGRIFAQGGGLSGGISSIVSSFTALINPLTLTLAGIGALAAAVPKISSFVDASVALGEEASKNAQIFGEFTQQILAFSKTSEVLGISETAALKATGTFGNLFNAIGLGAEQSANWSVELTKLAADLASFNNTSVEDAIQAIGAALRGEAEPIRRYGVLLNDATLKQVAFAEGLIKSEKEALAPATKAQAAYLAVMQQTVTAQGDVLRTADSIANLQRRVGAQFENLAAEAGKSFEPLWRAGLELTSAFGEAIGELSKALSPVIGLLGMALVGAIRTVTEGLKAIAYALKTIRETAESAFEYFGFTTAAVEDTAKAANNFRQEVSRPIPESILKQTQQEAQRLTETFRQASRDISQYGAEAGNAYLRLQQSIQAARDNIDRTTSDGMQRYNRAIQQANDHYQRQIELIKEAESKRLGQIKAEQDIIAKLLEQQKIQQQFGGDSQRAQAAEYFKAISNEIARLQTKLQDVINSSAEDDVRKQIQNLQQLAREQANIASGRAQAQQAAHEKELARAQQLAASREAAERQATERLARERQTINQYVDNQLELQRFNGDAQRLAASKQLAAIEAEIIRVQREGANARARGDDAGFKAAVQRVQQLNQIADKERDIAEGRAQAEAKIAEQRDAALKSQQAQQKAFAEQQQAYWLKAIAQQQQRIQEFNNFLQANARENARVLENYRKLATASNQTAKGADIRTQEGANMYLQSLQGAFDPSLAVQRQILKVQNRIAVGIEANLKALGFQTVRFPGFAGA